MPRPSGDLGWIEDPVEVDAQTVLMGGDRILFGNSEFSGAHKRMIASGVTGVFPHLAERKLFGKFKPSFTQRRGTCVGQGTARALQDSYYNSLLTRGLIGRKVDIAVAPIYGGGRVEIGKGTISGDGLVGGWAARYVFQRKVVARQKVGRYDLSQQNGDESYAVSWGARGVGVPKEVQDAGEVTAICFRCTTLEDIADAAFLGFGLSNCGRRTYGPKDRNGVSRLSSPSNHCTEAVGAALTPNNEILIGGQQSWGDDAIPGPNVLTYKGGKVDLRGGMCFVPIEDYYSNMKNNGEIWAFQFIEAFPAKTMDDLA